MELSSTTRGEYPENGKGCDIGYAPAVCSCEGAEAWMHVPSQPLMRSLLSQFQTPTAPRRNRTLKVWDVDSGHELRTLQGHLWLVDAVAVSGDGRRAASSLVSIA